MLRIAHVSDTARPLADRGRVAQDPLQQAHHRLCEPRPAPRPRTSPRVPARRARSCRRQRGSCRGHRRHHQPRAGKRVRRGARLLDGVARSAEVTVVPGNHDIYLPSIHRERRFPHHFGRFLRSDLPDLALELPAGPYPCVKLRGRRRSSRCRARCRARRSSPPAISAMRSSRPWHGCSRTRRCAADADDPHPPSAGRHAEPARAAARRPAWMPRRCGALWATLPQGLVLFGHLHVRVRCRLRTASGVLDVIGASGAALDHPDPSVRAGFNLYEIEDDGSDRHGRGACHRPPGLTLRRTTIAERPACA